MGVQPFIKKYTLTRSSPESVFQIENSKIWGLSDPKAVKVIKFFSSKNFDLILYGGLNVVIVE